MMIEEIKILPPLTKLVDSMTGEHVQFLKYEYPYATCSDSRKQTVWLLPGRLYKAELKS